MSSSLYSHPSSGCSKASCAALLYFSFRPKNQWSTEKHTMKSLNNRADSHLTGQVECELDSMGNGSWVNQGYCGSPPPPPRAVSTIYNPQPLYKGSTESMYKLDTPGPFHYPSEGPQATEKSQVKKRGCCSFIKGRNKFSWVYQY